MSAAEALSVTMSREISQKAPASPKFASTPLRKAADHRE
jgi:hypothetical protein